MMGSTGFGAVVLGHAAQWIGTRATLATGGVGTMAIAGVSGLFLLRHSKQS